MRNFLLFTLFPLISFSQTQIGNDIDGESASDNSGFSVSISHDGNIIAIGAHYNDGNGVDSGHTRIYQNNTGVWTQVGNDINGEASNNISGYSVSLSSNGNVVAIGAPFNEENESLTGHVRVYENILGTWTKIGNDINGTIAGELSGISVSLSFNGNLIAIGSPGSTNGHVRVFENISGTWAQIGNDIIGENPSDNFGNNIEISSNGNIIAIGGPLNDGNGSNSGHVRVFENIAGTWTQIGNDIDGENAEDQSGWDIDISGDGSIVAIGANKNDGSGNNSGHVRIFKNIAGIWTQIGNDINGENIEDESGFNVSISHDGNIVAIGAYFNDGNGNNSGHVRIYKNIAGIWTQIGNDINGENSNNWYGYGMDLSSDGTKLGIGGHYNTNSNGAYSGHVRVFDISSILSSSNFVQSNFSIYPNPTSETLTIELENNLILEKVNIYNTLGKVIKTESNTNIDVSKLQKGTYFVEVITNQGKATKSIIVN